MSYSLEDKIKKVKEKEACIAYELYYLLRNAISSKLVYEDSRCEFKEVLPEYPIGDERADLVVFAAKYGGALTTISGCRGKGESLC